MFDGKLSHDCGILLKKIAGSGHSKPAYLTALQCKWYIGVQPDLHWSLSHDFALIRDRKGTHLVVSAKRPCVLFLFGYSVLNHSINQPSAMHQFHLVIIRWVTNWLTYWMGWDIMDRWMLTGKALLRPTFSPATLLNPLHDA